jgi:formiminotetrahydrofolate cyclodeaminase
MNTLTLAQFLDQMASSDPTPGAGRAALLNVRINLRAPHQVTESVRTLGMRADVLWDEALAAVDQRLAPRSGTRQP